MGNDRSPESQQVIKIFEIVLKYVKDFFLEDDAPRVRSFWAQGV